MAWKSRKVELAYKKWVASRPECVRELIKKFPMETHWRFMVDDKVYFLLGYTENAQLIVSHINPNMDYENAINNKEYICGTHLIDHEIVTMQ